MQSSVSAKPNSPPAPRGFPIRIGLLSITDIVTIIAGASISSAHPAAPLPPTEEIAALFADLAGRLSPQALPGLSERDVLDLCDHLNARWPGNATLQSLGAARYWDQFREIAAHLTERDRRRVLALLWRNDPSFTGLFDRLCDGLDKLGQGADAYCPTEALLGKDKASGWLTRHPRSIVDDTTLRSLDQPHGPMLAMMNRYGQTVDVERAVIAALICDMTLHLSATRLNDLAPADLLDFPVPPAIASIPPPASLAQAANHGVAMAIAHFARTKAIHLFERACHRRDVTGLVIVIDPAQEDDTYAQAIGDWVEATQGPNAHARERVRRGLFIAAMNPAQPSPSVIAANETRVQSVIREIIGGEQEWPITWTPNRPMTEVFWFTPDETLNPNTISPSAPQSSSMVLAPLASSANAGTHRAPSNIAQLISSIALASNPRAKQLQLNQSLQERRRRIRQTVLRHHTSNDPSALSMWRRSTAVVVQDRLQFIIDQNRLGALHRALIPSEDDLIIPIRIAQQLDAAKSAASAKAAPWREGALNSTREGALNNTREGIHNGAHDDPRGNHTPGSQSSPERAGSMASIAIAHWFKSMRRASRSPRLCRDLRIEMGVMHHLVDELQIGALRCGLSSEIANAYLQSAPPAAHNAAPETHALTSADRDIVRLTAYACRIITAYFEVLGSVPGRGHNTHARPPRGSTYDLEVAESAPSGYASLAARPMAGARRSTRPALAQWEVSFVSLVEDNIASAHMMAGRGDKDRELGELIQLFASGPFEVEQ